MKLRHLGYLPLILIYAYALYFTWNLPVVDNFTEILRLFILFIWVSPIMAGGMWWAMGGFGE